MSGRRRHRNVSEPKEQSLKRSTSVCLEWKRLPGCSTPFAPFDCSAGEHCLRNCVSVASSPAAVRMSAASRQTPPREDGTLAARRPRARAAVTKSHSSPLRTLSAYYSSYSEMETPFAWASWQSTSKPFTTMH